MGYCEKQKVITLLISSGPVTHLRYPRLFLTKFLMESHLCEYFYTGISGFVLFSMVFPRHLAHTGYSITSWSYLRAWWQGMAKKYRFIDIS